MSGVLTNDTAVQISPDGSELLVRSGGTLKVESGGTFSNEGTVTSEGTQTFDEIAGNDSSLGIAGKAADTVTSAGGAVAIVGAAGGATSGTGGAVTSVAGAGTAAAAIGGANSSTAGAGSAGATTVDGGVGGAASLVAGVGGAKADTGIASGGVGGATALTAGVGGATASTDAGEVGGIGGAVTITSGAGGAASAGTGDGGAGADITLTPGSGGTSDGGAAGAPGDVVVSTGVVRFAVQTIAMADSPVTLTLVPGTPTGTLLTGNVIYADPGGNHENLLLPPEADCTGLFLIIENAADAAENVVVQNNSAGAVITVGQNEVGYCTCNGTAWNGSTGVA